MLDRFWEIVIQYAIFFLRFESYMPYFSEIKTIEDFRKFHLWVRTDSYAAIIGGMIGALRGSFYPDDSWSSVDIRYRQMIDDSIGKMKSFLS